MLQALESRRMLSASVVDGALVIEGTRRSDAINVFAADSGTTVRVVVNGEQQAFVRSSFDRIRVKAGRGDDSVVIGISGSFAVRAPSVIDAGDGDDIVQGGNGRDRISGGAGDDTISGNKGADTVRGGAGDDAILGGSAADLIYGNGGADRLAGGNGGDTLSGGDGDDFLREDAGEDRIRGNAGHDLFLFSDSAKDVRDETEGETLDPAATPMPGENGFGDLTIVRDPVGIPPGFVTPVVTPDLTPISGSGATLILFNSYTSMYGGSLEVARAANDVTVDGGFTGNDGNRAYPGALTMTGQASLVKSGSGSLTLTGVNTFAGLTSNNLGTLTLVGAGAASGAVTITSPPPPPPTDDAVDPAGGTDAGDAPITGGEVIVPDVDPVADGVPAIGEPPISESAVGEPPVDEPVV